jgi:CheY-like chemotaxis protein
VGAEESTTRRRVLVVEDEVLVAMLIGDMLADLRCEIAATVGRLDEAVRLAQTAAFDLAILDVNLAGQATYAVAEALRDRRIPFVFATGYAAAQIDKTYEDAPVLPKPFQQQDLARAIGCLFGGDPPVRQS